MHAHATSSACARDWLRRPASPSRSRTTSRSSRTGSLADTIVLSGSSAPWSVRDPDELRRLGAAVRGANRPVLGICAGMQLLAVFSGGAIGPATRPERGFLPVSVHDTTDLLRGLAPE